jgi:hypothetical protein
MNVKSLIVILSAIQHARDTILYLACENCPHSDFLDADLQEIFCDLNRMIVRVNNKMDEIISRTE